MNSSGLFAELKKHPWIMALVILVHIGLVVLLSINLSNDEKPPMPMAQKHNIINAVAVDAKKYDEREKQKKNTAQKKIEDKKTAEKKRLAEKKKAAEKKRQQEVEKKKVTEKKLAIAKKKEAEKKAKEKKEKEQKVREKLEKERKEQARLEAEKKRKLEEDRKLEEERKRRADEKAEFERALVEEERREEEEKRQAERTARLQTQRQQYIMQIAQDVENSWLRPVTNIEGQSCGVFVTQTMTGVVMDVRLQSCTSDNAFQRSVERAVHKASPLPMPPNPDVFDREIYFTFKPR